jgi:Fur family ferric uptake transcriptional regulator
MAQQDIKDILHEHGLKATEAHIFVFSFMQDARKPLTAQALIDVAHGNFNDSTIYRILKKFVGAGLVKELLLSQGVTYYEIKGHHHHHIVCVKCGYIEGLNIECKSFLAQDFLENNQSFHKIVDHSMELFAICKKCA